MAALLPRCRICLQISPRLKFATGRISICASCIDTLNTTSLSPSKASHEWRSEFIARLQQGAHEWSDAWFSQRLAESMVNPRRVQHSTPLKVLRAYRAGLVCNTRRYLKTPTTFGRTHSRVKQQDGSACYICRFAEAEGAALHVHHIVFRSRSGTNAKKNLITLCIPCHQAQHPEFVIGQYGGEPPGVDSDDELEKSDPLDELDEIDLLSHDAEVVEATSRIDNVATEAEWNSAEHELASYSPRVESTEFALPLPPTSSSDADVAIAPAPCPKQPSYGDNRLVFAMFCFTLGGLLIVFAVAGWLAD